MVPYFRSTPAISLRTVLVTLLPFNVGISLIFINYYLCVTTSPGSVPVGWEPDWNVLGITEGRSSSRDTATFTTTNDDGAAVEVKRFTGAPRFCKVCKAYKPPRAHHCRTCKQCVLRMDHHCPWVANCVGHGNYGHFIRFLVVVDVTCSYHLIMLSLRVADWWNPWSFWRQPSTGEMVFLVLNYALCIPVLLLVGMFSLYHLYCLATNTTTIESWEKDRVATMVRRGKIREVKYPYYLGFFRNIQSVLGNSPLLWCVPQPTPGDGLHYAVSPGHEPHEQLLWPPKDPMKSKSRRIHKPGTVFRLPEQGPFTYGNGFNPALAPSNTARRSMDPSESDIVPENPHVSHEIPSRVPQDLVPHETLKNDGLRRRHAYDAFSHSGEQIPFNHVSEVSAVPPWRRDYEERQMDEFTHQKYASSESESDENSSEDSNIDAGCIPPSKVNAEPQQHSDTYGTASRGQTFPPLWPEDSDHSDESNSELGSEYDSEEGNDMSKYGSSTPVSRSWVRRGSEGLEVRPKRFDFAFQLEQEQEAFQQYMIDQARREQNNEKISHFSESPTMEHGAESSQLQPEYTGHLHAPSVLPPSQVIQQRIDRASEDQGVITQNSQAQP